MGVELFVLLVLLGVVVYFLFDFIGEMVFELFIQGEFEL